MFNFLKNNKETGQTLGGVKGSSVQPPKNLPELARDIYEHDTPSVSISTSGIGNSGIGNSGIGNSEVGNTGMGQQSQNNPQNNSSMQNQTGTLYQGTSPSQSGEDSPLIIQSSTSPDLSGRSFGPEFMAPPELDQKTALSPTYDIVNAYDSVNTPDATSVPRLDVSLIKQRISGESSNAGEIRSDTGTRSDDGRIAHPETMIPANSPMRVPTQHPIMQQHTIQSIPAAPPNAPKVRTHQPQETMLQDSIRNIDDSTGFFKEFEEYVRNNGLNTDVIESLLDKNLLDHMMFYHSTKSADMPFYASSSELSHAIKLKLEELQNLERNWIYNKQKAELLRKLSSTMESDIHVRSEELKRMMYESRKRVTPNSHGGSSKENHEENRGYVRNAPVLAESSSSISSEISANMDSANMDNDNIHAEILGHIDGQTDDSESKNAMPDDISDTLQNAVPIPVDPISTNMVNTNLNKNARTNTNNNIHNNYQRDNSFSYDSVPAHTVSLSKGNIHLSLSDGLHIVSDDAKGFYLDGGIILRSISQLAEAIENMDEDTYRHYVNDKKNDFANWIRHVFGNKELADTLRASKDRMQLLNVLKSHLTM